MVAVLPNRCCERRKFHVNCTHQVCSFFTKEWKTVLGTARLPGHPISREACILHKVEELAHYWRRLEQYFFNLVLFTFSLLLKEHLSKHFLAII
jgi:hypothetical protein